MGRQSAEDPHEVIRRDTTFDKSASIADSMLRRVQAQEPEAWHVLVEAFGPVVHGWCRRAGLNASDAADVGQDVFQAVAQAIPQFRREQQGDTFRGWLWRIAQHKITDYWRRREREAPGVGGTNFQGLLAQVAAEESVFEASGLDVVKPREDFQQGLDVVRAEFEERSWQAFWLATVDGRAPAEVAEELGMSRTAVYIAKSRILRRLRDQFQQPSE